MSQNDTTEQVRQAQNGDRKAFNWLVRQYQDMAVAYAISRIGDLHTAQDAAQEAFVETFRILPTLRAPEAFLVWFRKVIAKHCDRMTRRKRVETISLDYADALAENAPGLDEIVMQHQTQRLVSDALQELPDGQRVVLTLFYLGGQSHQEIAAFLELTVSTVKSRLHDGRKRLKERLNLMNDTFQEQRPSRDDVFMDRVNQDIQKAIAGVAAGAGAGSVYHDPHPVFRLSSTLLLWAIEESATEIRFLPENGQVAVEFIVDRVARAVLSLPKSLQEPLTVRLKVMADLEIRAGIGPQEGMFPISYQNRDYAAYVMTQPNDNGEIICVRLYYPPCAAKIK